MDLLKLDIDRWISEFPLSDGDDAWNDLGMGTARGAACFEQLRTRIAKSHDLGPSVPVDNFVWGYGEPERRDITKIGGLPYRPAVLKWPTFEGLPMTFVAQFRFAESMDYLGELPGAVLLVFFRDNWITPELIPGVVVFEWYPLGLKDLARAVEVPPPGWDFVTAYGVRHRTVNYPEQSTHDLIKRLALPGIEDYYEEQYGDKLGSDDAADRLASNFCSGGGAGIGGVCFWPPPNDNDLEFELPARYLCSFSGVGPGSGEYPWLNQPQPLDVFEVIERSDELMFSMWDGFVMNFSIDEGEVHWILQKD